MSKTLNLQSVILFVLMMMMMMLLLITIASCDERTTKQLHDAIKNNHWELINQLIKGGEANPYEKVDYWFSKYDAFDIAVYYGNTKFLTNYMKQLEKEQEYKLQQLKKEQDQIQLETQLANQFKNTIYMTVLVIVGGSFLGYWYIQRKLNEQIEQENKQVEQNLRTKEQEKIKIENKLIEIGKEKMKIEVKLNEILEKQNSHQQPETQKRELERMKIELETANHELMDLKEKIEEEQRCCICMDRNKNAAFNPCGHVFCETCCSHCLSKCPICKTKPRSFYKLYM
ncbi:predicted protein [Naegleria gruberi]|uniref:Predicted protein n=1 Tax=Naegleria gruberi TaxID=5762 RepID=D2W5Y2_NAEGR|nr:uncharacterized protein NAEGRDRAFT_76826 [Naegleria gruberi]EFC35519.1 predicted protein [Naegleria gruberi]|eukprot:XP_002668263.1 predicted protein [Naegleria gruberi strain NEG-M]